MGGGAGEPGGGRRTHGRRLSEASVGLGRQPGQPAARQAALVFPSLIATDVTAAAGDPDLNRPHPTVAEAVQRPTEPPGPMCTRGCDNHQGSRLGEGPPAGGERVSCLLAHRVGATGRRVSPSHGALAQRLGGLGAAQRQHRHRLVRMGSAAAAPTAIAAAAAAATAADAPATAATARTARNGAASSRS